MQICPFTNKLFNSNNKSNIFIFLFHISTSLCYIWASRVSYVSLYSMEQNPLWTAKIYKDWLK